MITIKDLTVIYPAKPVNIIANRGINLEIAGSGLIVITGPNGSGKSTLFKLLCGQLLPTAGQVFINQKLLTQGDITNTLKELVEYAPQDFNLDPNLSGDDYFKKLEKSNENNLIKILTALKIKSIWGEKILKLSRHDRQLVALTLSLLSDKKVLLLDEPTKYLDKSSRANLLKLLQQMAKARSILIATHDPLWTKMSKSSIHIQDGRIVQIGGRNSKDEFGWHFAGKVVKPKKLGELARHKNISYTEDLESFFKAAEKSAGKIRLFDPELTTFDEVSAGEYFAHLGITLPDRLKAHRSQPMKTLSGGERGWSYLYSLLATKPKQIFLLYPSLNLDLENLQSLHKMITALANSGSKFTIFEMA